jgi:hypothetical protein
VGCRGEGSKEGRTAEVRYSADPLGWLALKSPPAMNLGPKDRRKVRKWYWDMFLFGGQYTADTVNVK